MRPLNEHPRLQELEHDGGYTVRRLIDTLRDLESRERWLSIQQIKDALGDGVLHSVSSSFKTRAQDVGVRK